MRGLWTLVAAGLAAGCTPAGQDVGPTGTDPDGAPDLTGDYDLVTSDHAGCEGVAVPLEWIDGPLAVSGDPGALAFAFGEATIDGSVDATYTVLFGGDVSLSSWALSVDAEGLAYIDADRWVLEGDLFLDAAGPTDATCSLSAQFSAVQIVE